MLYKKSCNACEKRDGDGYEHCYKIEAVLHVLDVTATVMEVMDISIESEDVMHVIHVMVMVMEVMDIVIGFKL